MNVSCALNSDVRRLLACVALLGFLAVFDAAAQDTKLRVSESDLRLVSRAGELLDRQDKWLRSNTDDCPTTSASITLYCAFVTAAHDVGGNPDGSSAAFQEARVTISLVAPREYGQRFEEFNADSAVTFADLQGFMRILHNRLARRYAPSRSSAAAEEQPPVSTSDLAIIRRARDILSSDTRWNRGDNRQCPDKASKVSIYCALERATSELTSRFGHRDAAMQEARFVVEEIAPNGEYYGHRLMDFNNDPATTFFDVEKFFFVLRQHIAQRLESQSGSTGHP